MCSTFLICASILIGETEGLDVLSCTLTSRDSRDFTWYVNGETIGKGDAALFRAMDIVIASKAKYFAVNTIIATGATLTPEYVRRARRILNSKRLIDLPSGGVRSDGDHSKFEFVHVADLNGTPVVHFNAVPDPDCATLAKRIRAKPEVGCEKIFLLVDVDAGKISVSLREQLFNFIVSRDHSVLVCRPCVPHTARGHLQLRE